MSKLLPLRAATACLLSSVLQTLDDASFDPGRVVGVKVEVSLYYYDYYSILTLLYLFVFDFFSYSDRYPSAGTDESEEYLGENTHQIGGLSQESTETARCV